MIAIWFRDDLARLLRGMVTHVLLTSAEKGIPIERDPYTRGFLDAIGIMAVKCGVGETEVKVGTLVTREGR